MTRHVPVLLREVLHNLAVQDNGAYLDCTFGGGGHANAILNAANNVTLTALDCDPEAEERARSLVQVYGGNFQFKLWNFERITELPENAFNGILFDLGVSSFHLDDPERGFSFREDAPLDMRMDNRAGQTAAEFLESASQAELVRAVRDYGEETRWKAVVRAIIQARGTGQLQRTAGLAQLIQDAIPAKFQRRRGGFRESRAIHPATKSFQGIRIAVNRELEVIEQTLPVAFEKLAPGGRLVVISFHSLEDRLVKRFFRRMAGMPENAYDNRPQQDRDKRAELLTRKPATPLEDEIARNPRARSAKLRALTKL